PDARLLVEQKSTGVDLDRPEPRQGTMVTPVEQALRYANTLPASEKPAKIITCNFSHFRVYDLDADPLAKAPADEFDLADLADHLGTLGQIVSPEHRRLVVEQQLSIEAGKLVAEIHASLAAQYQDPDAPDSHHSLATLVVRIVFCLYAEDAGLFPKGAFANYLRGYSPDHARRALIDLFHALDTPESERNAYDTELTTFKYVDGGLFSGQVEIPGITAQIRNSILKAADEFDWSRISPVIFGSLMEETLSHDERRQGGMHYTSVENIHKVIDPLFLDELQAELQTILNAQDSDRVRRGKLRAFQDKLAGLQFLDPACGSGNFLTETFLSLRKLEDQVLQELAGGQGSFDLGGNMKLAKVSIDQMHGIEINDFAVSVAKTALWIAEQQAAMDAQAITQTTFETLPLHDSGHIVQANALQADWNTILPGKDCDFVMGNPPFVGRKYRTPAMVSDMKHVFGDAYDVNLDYAASWYWKAARYLSPGDGAFALVSTNSISQGQAVSTLFDPLFNDGWRVRFAHTAFVWDAQSTDVAHVHVVIIGLDRNTDTDRPPVLYVYENIKGSPERIVASHINAYLADAPNISIQKRLTPLSPDIPTAAFGAMANDGGTLIIDNPIDYERASHDPVARQCLREFIGARELVRSIKRWCLWIEGPMVDQISTSKILTQHVKACAAWRARQKTTGQAYQWREQPWRFGQLGERYTTQYVIAPRVVSENRPYFTPALAKPEVIASDSCITMADPHGIAFAILSSRAFLVWQLAIGGRLKSDIRFSRNIVWYNFPLPELTQRARDQLEEAGQTVIDARASHPTLSIAKLYDPVLMPPDLRIAHRELDAVMDGLYGLHAATDDARLAALVREYRQLRAE
ncbi:MAG: N-6 DNA methylase, partial [Microbacteriaceae bacterium]|nr:N-6 DNA methylase [Microbacteriaceae bacterium]